MRLATFFRQSAPGQPRLGALVGDRMLDFAQCANLLGGGPVLPESSMRQLLALGKPGLNRANQLVGYAAGAGTKLPAGALLDPAEYRFLPPIPDADKFLCVGKNYRTHLEELRRTDLIREMPTEPTGFIKLNSCLTGHESNVVRPDGIVHLDYEPELVFVIGKRALGVQKNDAFDYIAGITLLNDLTCRDLQKREVASGSRFWTGKNIPGFGPLGPCIITMDEVPDPYDIWVTCSVNGEQRMRVNTCDQIWKLPAIVEHFSRYIPLEPGDMVECAFENPAMVLRNRIVAPH
jgi:2-keto-4-pentenoate hydratase/2-oxohepta-3-ene-1,7-dioic acid hydratase in catechol pathway